MKIYPFLCSGAPLYIGRTKILGVITGCWGEESWWLQHIITLEALQKLVRNIIHSINYFVWEQLLNPADILNIFNYNLNRAGKDP